MATKTASDYGFSMHIFTLAACFLSDSPFCSGFKKISKFGGRLAVKSVAIDSKRQRALGNQGVDDVVARWLHQVGLAAASGRRYPS